MVKLLGTCLFIWLLADGMICVYEIRQGRWRGPRTHSQYGCSTDAVRGNVDRMHCTVQHSTVCTDRDRRMGRGDVVGLGSL